LEKKTYVCCCSCKFIELLSVARIQLHFFLPFATVIRFLVPEGEGQREKSFYVHKWCSHSGLQIMIDGLVLSVAFTFGISSWEMKKKKQNSHLDVKRHIHATELKNGSMSVLSRFFDAKQLSSCHCCFLMDFSPRSLSMIDCRHAWCLSPFLWLCFFFFFFLIHFSFQ
jgi:hypothetical protein